MSNTSTPGGRRESSLQDEEAFLCWGLDRWAKVVGPQAVAVRESYPAAWLVRCITLLSSNHGNYSLNPWHMVLIMYQLMTN